MPSRKARPRVHAAAGACGLACVLAAGLASATLSGFGGAVALLPQDVRQQLEARARHWQALAPAARDALRGALATWDRQPIAERARMREAYRAWQALPAGERARVQAAAAAYATLPGERQAALRAEFEALDGSERRGWLLGPALGHDYPRLQPLLAQLPEAEHAAVLRTLRAMTPVQRELLATLVHRTPPAERAALRVELASTAAVHRDAWLWQRLDR